MPDDGPAHDRLAPIDSWSPEEFETPNPIEAQALPTRSPHSERTAFQEPAFSSTGAEETSRQHAAKMAGSLRMAAGCPAVDVPDQRQGETREGRVIVASAEMHEAGVVIGPLADAAPNRGPVTWSLVGTDGQQLGAVHARQAIGQPYRLRNAITRGGFNNQVDGCFKADMLTNGYEDRPGIPAGP